MTYRKLAIQFVVSLGIAAFFLWLTINHIATDASDHLEGSIWGSLKQSLLSVPLHVVALYSAIFLGVHLARIWRCKYLLNPLGEPDNKRIFSVCAIGFSAIVIFPLRLGEMVRPYLLAKESEKVTMSAALGATVMERVLDGLTVTALLFVALATYDGRYSTGFVTNAAIIALMVFGGALIVLVVAAFRHNWTVRVLEATFGRVSKKLCEAIVELVDSFLDGVRVLNRSGVLLHFFGWTIIYWGLNGFGIYVLANGFGFALTLWQAYAILAILVIGIMIPSGPGFFGTFQFFLIPGLALFASPQLVESAGLAFGLTMNAIQFVIQVGFGLPFFIVSQMGLAKLIQATGEAQPQGS